MYNKRYNEFSNELVNTVGIPAYDIFDYQFSPIALLFDRFYNFCQDNLSFHCSEYDIQPAIFYYKNDKRVNAGAGKLSSFFLIEMNMGTLVTMYNFFYNENVAFSKDTYLKRDYVGLTPADAPPDFIMYQVAIQFTYYHELGHLVQKSPLLSHFLTEKYTSGGSDFTLLKHLMEFDADLYAAQMIFFHIQEFWGKLPIMRQTGETLSKFIALYLSSIFIYLTYLEGNPTPLYFAEQSHPHPLVRITYILDIIISVAEKNIKDIKINAGKVLSESFNISEKIAVANKRTNPVERYANVIRSANDEITAYVNKLISESEKYPFLVKNRNNK